MFKSNNMDKMSRTITIILIIMIIFVVGIVSYYSFHYFKNKKINQNALKEIEEFNRNTPTLTIAEYEDLVAKGLINDIDIETVAGKEINIKEVDEKNLDFMDRNFNNSTEEFTTKFVGTIRIPKTHIKYSIYTPPGQKVLEQGIGMLTTEKGLNNPGNTTLQGHNWRNRMFFSRNNLLVKGDSIFIKDRRGLEIEYIVYKKMVIKPSDSKYITRKTNNKREISLSTCFNTAKERLVILAREK